MSRLSLPIDRDFRGYHGADPAIRWPNDARLAVSIVVNVEEGAELAVSSGDDTNEAIYEAVEQTDGARNLCMESHYEYGTRRGWQRVRQALAERGMQATLNACGRALACSPWLGAEAAADGHEVSAHGWRWERHLHMQEADERRVIARTIAAITESAGSAPRGWHTRSATSPNTRRLLLEQGGFLYDSNAYNDDCPYMAALGDRDLVVMPYAFDTNDMRFQPGGGFVHGEDFTRYCVAAFERLYAEGAEGSRMMSIGLHLRIIGRPARIGALEALLDHMASKSGVWFARRRDIAHAWRAGLKLPEWRPRPAISAFDP